MSSIYSSRTLQIFLTSFLSVGLMTSCTQEQPTDTTENTVEQSQVTRADQSVGRGWPVPVPLEDYD